MKIQDIMKKYNVDGNAQTRKVSHVDVLRFDGVGQMKDTDEGYLTGIAPVAKVGVMSYLMADGTVLREFVPPETLFEGDSMITFKMKPVTDQHPPEKKVDSENAYYRQIGYTGENVKQDGTMLMTNLTITDGCTIENVKDGQQELSPGYECELVFQQGTHDGVEYDAIQLKRRYNHLAVVDNARGGTDIRMKLDSADKDYGFERSVKTDSKPINQKPKSKERHMAKFLIDGLDYECAAEVVNHISKLQTQIDSQKTEIGKLKEDGTKVIAERDALKTENDSLKARNIAKEVNDGVKARLALERKATSVLGKVDNVDSLSNRELKEKMVDSKYPELLKTKTDEEKKADTYDVYLDTLIDTIKVEDGGPENNLDSQRASMNKDQKPGSTEQKTDSESARARMDERNANAWKSPEQRAAEEKK